MPAPAESAERRWAELAPKCIGLNIMLALAALVDYFLQEIPWALLSLAFYVILVNGGFLLLRHHERDAAIKRDIEERRQAAEAEARRQAHLRERGLL